MSPDHVAEESDPHHAIDDGLMAEQWPPVAVDQNVRDDSGRRQDGDVNFRVPEEPEQVLPEKWRSA